MNKKIIFTFQFSIISILVGQKSFMQVPINSILYNETDPILNGKGTTMLLKTESPQEPVPYWTVSYGSGDKWATPMSVDALNFSSKTILNISPSLNVDGNTIYFSSNRYGGIGAGDIWILNKTSGGWENKPLNLGMPINSKEYESDPFLAPDGKTLFFIRYNGNKTTDNLPCGDIYFATLSGKTWSNPQKLPAPINSGCECSPQMLMDNETFYFGSQRSGGKGGFDIYVSKLEENGVWANPVAFEQFNTKLSEKSISVPALGAIAYFSSQGSKSKDIARMIVPQNLQAIKTLVLTPKISSQASGEQVNSKILIKNLSSNFHKEIIVLKDRNTPLFLHYPNKYLITYTDPSSNLFHHTTLLDLTGLKSFTYKTDSIKMLNSVEKWALTLPDFIVDSNKINLGIYSDELNRINLLAQKQNHRASMILTFSDSSQIDSVKIHDLQNELKKTYDKIDIKYDVLMDKQITHLYKDVIVRFTKD